MIIEIYGALEGALKIKNAELLINHILTYEMECSGESNALAVKKQW